MTHIAQCESIFKKHAKHCAILYAGTLTLHAKTLCDKPAANYQMRVDTLSSRGNRKGIGTYRESA